MKLFKKSYDLLSSKQKVLLKLKMGFPITLSDIDNKPITKRLLKKIQKERIKI